MPIYAYKCESCGHAKDVLQKMSDVPLVDCPACGASSFKKQLTAAGFQLKGSGWYVTDFRDGKGGASTEKTKEGEKSKESSGSEKADTPAISGSDSATTPAKTTATTPAAAPAPTPVAASPTPAPKATP